MFPSHDPGGVWYVHPADYQQPSYTLSPALIGGYKHGSANPSFYNNETTAESWSVFANERTGLFQLGEELTQAGNSGLQAVVGHIIAKYYRRY